MDKKRLTGVAVILLFCCINNAEAQNNLVVETSDGNKEEYQINEIRKITFTDESMNILPKNSVRADSYMFEYIVNMYFKKTESGLEYIGPETDLSIMLSDDQTLMSINGLVKETDIQIFDTNGKLSVRKPLNKGEYIDITHLQPGVYIVLADNQPLKFVKSRN